MNILLQNKKTRDYVERDGGWTARADQARVFGSGLEPSFTAWTIIAPICRYRGSSLMRE